MKNKVNLFALLMAVMMASSGCQLAKEEVQTVGTDRLVGVFITTEYLDLFNWEGYLNDNVGKLSGDTVLSPEDSREYEGRIYAELINEGGQSEYRFTDLEGMSLYAVEIPASESNSSPFVTTVGGEGIMDIHFDLSGSEEKLYGTIYHLPANDLCFYFNPVYQTENGEVYLMAGQGMMTNNFGGSMSHSMTGSITVTEDGEEKTLSNTTDITIECTALPKTVEVIQMNADHSILARAVISPGEAPESIAPAKDCAYLVVETRYDHGKTPEGMSDIERIICQRDTDKHFRTFYDRGDGICLVQYTNIEW